MTTVEGEDLGALAALGPPLGLGTRQSAIPAGETGEISTSPAAVQTPGEGAAKMDTETTDGAGPLPVLDLLTLYHQGRALGAQVSIAVALHLTVRRVLPDGAEAPRRVAAGAGRSLLRQQHAGGILAQPPLAVHRRPPSAPSVADIHRLEADPPFVDGTLGPRIPQTRLDIRVTPDPLPDPAHRGVTQQCGRGVTTAASRTAPMDGGGDGVDPQVVPLLTVLRRRIREEPPPPAGMREQTAVKNGAATTDNGPERAPKTAGPASLLVPNYPICTTVQLMFPTLKTDRDLPTRIRPPLSPPRRLVRPFPSLEEAGNKIK